MPYKLFWEPSGVYRQYLGDVTIVERRESFDAICGDPRFDDLRFTITDYLAVGAYEITAEATAEIAALHIAAVRTNPRIAIAAVAVRPDIVEAIREFIGYRFTAAPYRIFSSLSEARRWLGMLPTQSGGVPEIQ